MEPERMYWEERYRQVTRPVIGPAITGYNVNLDRVITVGRDLLESPELGSGMLGGLKERLVSSMERCTAAEWIVDDPDLFRRISDFFAGSGSCSLGGQAGIAARHLTGLGAPRVFCAAPGMGVTATGMLREHDVTVVNSAGGPDCTHIILEYAVGLVPTPDDVIPRSNRFIISPQKTGLNTILSHDLLALVLQKVPLCTRAFLSGFQYLSGNEEFRDAVSQIRAMKDANRDLKVHIECVSVTDPAVNAGILHHILPAADSVGLNENELSLLLGRPCGSDPVMLVHHMEELGRLTGLSRIHLHTFGYYLLLLKNQGADPRGSQESLVFTAQVAAGAAEGTGTAVPAVGLSAVKMISGQFGPGPAPGIFVTGDYHLLVVPTLIAEGVSRTVGLGDIISSTGFVTDPFE